MAKVVKLNVREIVVDRLRNVSRNWQMSPNG
jgi:hypothetical protein